MTDWLRFLYVMTIILSMLTVLSISVIIDLVKRVQSLEKEMKKR